MRMSQKAHTGPSVISGEGGYSSRKGLAPWRRQCHQPRVGVPPLRLAGKPAGRRPLTKKRYPQIGDSFALVKKSPRDVLHTILKLSISAFRWCIPCSKSEDMRLLIKLGFLCPENSIFFINMSFLGLK